MKQLPDETGVLHPAVDVPVVLTCSFQTRSLSIRAPLAAAVHRFKLHNKIPIEIHIPGAPPRRVIGTSSDYERYDLWCHSWRSKTRTPTVYDVRRVRVYVDLQRTLTVPEACIGKVSPVHHSKSARHALNAVVEDAERIAEEAFRLWLRTLRWKSGFASINQMLIEPLDVTQGGRLAHATTRKSFYSPPITFTVGPSETITRRVWNGCGKALRDGDTPPLWCDFLSEGQHRISSSDLHGGIVTLAIACELLMRRLVMRPTNRRFFRMLETMPIGKIRDQWSNMGPTSKRLNAAMDQVKLKRLFDLRNGIMHRGEVRALNDVECRELSKIARTFIMAGTKLGERIPVPRRFSATRYSSNPHQA
jgi:hypothetical protein